MSLKHSYALIAPFYDAFLDAATRAARRRSLDRLATRLDVVFEDLLRQAPELVLESDEPALGSGWFRLLRLTKR